MSHNGDELLHYLKKMLEIKKFGNNVSVTSNMAIITNISDNSFVKAKINKPFFEPK